MHWETTERRLHQPIEATDATMAALRDGYGLCQGFGTTRTKQPSQRQPGFIIFCFQGRAQTPSEVVGQHMQTRQRQQDMQWSTRTRRASGASAKRMCASGSGDHIHCAWREGWAPPSSKQGASPCEYQDVPRICEAIVCRWFAHTLAWRTPYRFLEVHAVLQVLHFGLRLRLRKDPKHDQTRSHVCKSHSC
jgi:hypothetical protein